MLNKTLYAATGIAIIAISSCSDRASPTLDYGVSVAPNGDTIAYYSYRNGDPQIYLAQANGDAEVALTDNDNWNIEPAWTPDGAYIYFSSGPDMGRLDIYRIRPDGGDLQQVTDIPGTENGISVSPDGNRIAFYSRDGGRSGGTDIIIADIDGANQHTVIKRTSPDAMTLKPRWNPSGTELLYSLGFVNADDHDLYIYNLQSTERRLVVDSDGKERMPVFGPDDNTISFASDRDGDYDIYIKNLETGVERNLTNYSAEAEYFSAFSADGKYLYYDSQLTNGEARIFKIRIEDEDVTKITGR